MVTIGTSTAADVDLKTAALLIIVDLSYFFPTLGWCNCVTPRCSPTAAPRSRSEGHNTFDHESLELPAVPDVGGGEVEVLLVHELQLGQHVRGQEPAATNLA